jgi:hypothetical protein
VERETFAFFFPYRSTSEVSKPISEAKRLISFGVWDLATYNIGDFCLLTNKSLFKEHDFIGHVV